MTLDKDYLKTLSYEDQCIYKDKYRKARKKGWDEQNADKVFLYRRATTLKRCEERCSVPTKSTIQKYGFTPEELKPIWHNLWSKWDMSAPTDSDDSNHPDTEDIEGVDT